MKANTGSVNSDLGGGKHGNLGLELSISDYEKLDTVPYTKPTHPGLLVIPNAIAHHEAV